MNRLFSILLTIVWGIWLGALVGVLIAVTSLNKTFLDRQTFGVAASGVFHLFELIQLGLAGAALLFAFGWRLCRGASSLKTALFVLFALASASAAINTFYLTPQIDQMRIEGVPASDPARFGKFHGMSMGIYSSATLILAIAGIILPFALVREQRDRNPS